MLRSAGVRGLISMLLVVLPVAVQLSATALQLPGKAIPAADPPCGACIVLLVTPGQALALPPSLDGLDVLVAAPAGDENSALPALRDIAHRGGRPGMLVRGIPRVPIAHAILESATIVLVDLHGTVPPPDPDNLAFTLKTQFIAARAGTTRTLTLGVAGPAPVLESLRARDMGSYVDVMVWPDALPVEAAGPAAWQGGADGVPVMTSLVDALDATRGMRAARSLWRLPEAIDEAAALAAGLARAARWLPSGLVAPSTVDVRCGGTAAETFLDPKTLETLAIARSCRPSDSVLVAPVEPGVERVALAAEVALVRVPAAGAPDRFASGVDVLGTRALTVEEIVARHQAAAARQARLVQTLVSSGTLTLSFEAPGFPAPVTISSDTAIYTGDGRTELAQRRIRVNGMEFGGGVPRLPIIEPERVASPPLAITLTDVYRYRLAGQDEVRGTRCYAIDFEPVDARAPLFRGRAWIAADNFVMVKVAAAQTGLRGPIVASEQVDEFREEAAGVWLLSRSDVRQAYEGAGHRTPIHRLMVIERHEMNPADFRSRRQAAYASDAIMLRDTPEGFRYLQRERGGAPDGPSRPQPEPVLVERASRVRTLAAGVVIDPNISQPLPFAGLSYVDFDLFGTGTQLNAFFGGTYGQLAFSVPSVGGSRWQLAGRAFGIASSYNDRAFAGGREMYEQNIRQRPAHASVWLLRPLTPRITLRVGYDLDYTHFAAADITAPRFTVPADQVVHGARFAIDAQRAGWQASAWWNPARRTGWRAWGEPGSGDFDPAHAGFQRYGLSVSRSAVLTPRLAGRVEAAWMSGSDLDRFSRYAFGSFDNRLRGYPSALVRYDRGGVVRGALAWSAARFIRIDGFVDSATVRDRGYGTGLRNYTGVGAAVEAPAPFGMLIAVEWGYGFRGVDADGSLGTHVIRVSAFKVF